MVGLCFEGAVCFGGVCAEKALLACTGSALACSFEGAVGKRWRCVRFEGAERRCLLALEVLLAD
jgi:hypothetical protein